MAILNSIRRRSGFLIVIIALALFSFVLADVISNGGFSSNKANTIAKVNGKEVSREEFMYRVDAFAQNMGQAGSTTQVAEIVWEDELKSLLYDEQYQKLGLEAQRIMITDMLERTLQGNPSFMGANGQFDMGKVKEYVASIEATSPELLYEWNAFVKELEDNAKRVRYNNLVKAGLVTTSIEAKQQHKLENDKVNMKFAFVPYSSIDDNEVELTDADLKKYLQEHASQYQVDPSVSLQYVTFNEVASKKDEDNLKQSLIDLLDERVEYNAVTQENDTLSGFRSVQNYEEFVNSNSEVPYQDIWYYKNDLPEDKAEELSTAEVGQIVGPYKIHDSFVLSKVVEEAFLPDSVKARHILIAYTGAQNAAPDVDRNKEEAKQLADSIQGLVKADINKFSDLAAEFSGDASNKDKGGDLDYFGANRMVAPFNDFAFQNETGTVGVVETDFGYHIVSIDDQKNKSRALKLANIIQPIEPSEETIQDNFSAATKFEVDARAAKFVDVANTFGKDIHSAKELGQMESNIAGLGNYRNIVNWAFENKTKEGDFQRFDIAEGYVFVQVVKKVERGLMPTSDVSSAVIEKLRNAKKADIIKNSIKTNSLEEFASSQNLSIETATAVTRSNPRLPEVGVEPKVVGVAFGLDQDQTSKLIDGDKGVFMLTVTGKTPATEIDNYSSYLNKLDASIQTLDIESKVFNTLKSKAKIEDNRATFY